MHIARKLKSIALVAFTTLCTAFSMSAKAAPELGEKIPIAGGWTRTITDENGNGTSIVNVYTNTNTKGYEFIVPDRVTKIDYLVVGGGGSGGGGVSYNTGGGGGAGGVLTNTSPFLVTSGSVLSTLVGKGGAQKSSAGGQKGAMGGDSSLSGAGFDTLTAKGGGGGGSSGGAALAGGCGGGAGAGGSGNLKSGGAGTEGQGFKGGDAPYSKSDRSGAGGGGAGGPGVNSGKLTEAVGVGGKGILCDITGEELYYAGGGGGGSSASAAGAAGGSGIGGSGGYKNSLWGQPGVDGTGSGGGGSGAKATGFYSGRGGSGVVVIRYSPQVAAGFTWDKTKCGVVAYRGETEVTDAVSVNSNAVIAVTAVPNPTFGYTTIPEGWEAGENGTITKTFTASEDFVLAVPDPEKTGGGELVSVEFVEAQNASYVATMGGEPLIVTMVEKGSSIDVVASPNEHYAYATVPQDWTAGEGGVITRTYVASENITITIPAPDPIMVTVSVSVPAELGANVAYTITTNDVEIASGDKVHEGTEVIVTVAPQGIYEYSKAPANWTKNADGTIAYTTSAEVGMATIVVPTENFRKHQVIVKFNPQGVSYVATNLTTELQIKSGGNADVDAQIAVIVRPYSDEYTFVTPLPQGWVQVDENVVTALVAAVDSPISLPSATWMSTDGELIENGGFEFFDHSQYQGVNCDLPDSLVGNWAGSVGDEKAQYNCFGLWKYGETPYNSWTVNGSAHSGTFAAGLNSTQTSSYLSTKFVTPQGSRSSSRYLFSCYAKALRYDSTKNKSSLVVEIWRTNTLIQTVANWTPSGSWACYTNEVSGLTGGEEYTLKCHLAINASFAIDDVSLKMLPPKGTVIVIK